MRMLRTVSGSGKGHSLRFVSTFWGMALPKSSKKSCKEIPPLAIAVAHRDLKTRDDGFTFFDSATAISEKLSISTKSGSGNAALLKGSSVRAAAPGLSDLRRFGFEGSAAVDGLKVKADFFAGGSPPALLSLCFCTLNALRVSKSSLSMRNIICQRINFMSNIFTLRNQYAY